MYAIIEGAMQTMLSAYLKNNNNKKKPIITITARVAGRFRRGWGNNLHEARKKNLSFVVFDMSAEEQKNEPIFVDLHDNSKPAEIESYCMKCGENVSSRSLYYQVDIELINRFAGYYSNAVHQDPPFQVRARTRKYIFS